MIMKRKILLIHKCAIRASLMACLFACISHAYAQQRQVAGTVKDDQGQPLPGTNIVVKGTTTGTTTDTNGTYRLDAVSSQDILVFSFVGYLSQEIAVGNQLTFRSGRT